jgi:hypothetical protein
VAEHVRVQPHADRLPAALEHLAYAVRGEPSLLRKPQPRLVGTRMLATGPQVAVQTLRRSGAERDHPEPLPVAGVALALHAHRPTAKSPLSWLIGF